jgi:hypothetical protein
MAWWVATERRKKSNVRDYPGQGTQPVDVIYPG